MIKNFESFCNENVYQPQTKNTIFLCICQIEPTGVDDLSENSQQLDYIGVSKDIEKIKNACIDHFIKEMEEFNEIQITPNECKIEKIEDNVFNISCFDESGGEHGGYYYRIIETNIL